ncbi:MAG: hypothetical protein K0V04_40065 [Deltaproteobacteria bacterium]|nr:hypothetical protein [Deltaproteobacteria bacterium]
MNTIILQMKSQGLLAVTALGLALGTTACNELERIDQGDDGGVQIPDEVQRAFESSCNMAGCHDASAAGGLELTATAAPGIIGAPSEGSPLPLVELGNVQGSYLAVKILAEAPAGTTRTGARMPLGGNFDDTQTAIDSAIILGWIAGAQLPGGGGGGETTDGGSSGGDEVVSCELDVLAPGATNAFDIGMDAGQIPPDIGTVLIANCGCHETTGDFIEGVFPYTGEFHFSTIAEIQGDYMGAPALERLSSRVGPDAASPMPPNFYCDIDGMGTPIAEEDEQLLVAWLMAGAPDAVEWTPPGG